MRNEHDTIASQRECRVLSAAFLSDETSKFYFLTKKNVHGSTEYEIKYEFVQHPSRGKRGGIDPNNRNGGTLARCEIHLPS